MKVHGQLFLPETCLPVFCFFRCPSQREVMVLPCATGSISLFAYYAGYCGWCRGRFIAGVRNGTQAGKFGVFTEHLKMLLCFFLLSMQPLSQILG